MKASPTARTLTAVLCLFLLAFFMTLPLAASEAPIPNLDPEEIVGADTMSFITSLLRVSSLADVNGIVAAYDTGVLILVAIVALLFGMFGYRLFGIAIFTGAACAGFVLGSMLYGFVQPILPENLPSYLPIIVEIVFALTAIAVAFKLVKAGIFLATGAAVFFFLSGFELFNLFVDLIDSESGDVKYLIARLLVALIVGLIALKLTKPVMIITTSAAGGMIAGIAAMVLIGQAENLVIESVICTLLVILCFVVQFRTTRKKHR